MPEPIVVGASATPAGIARSVYRPEVQEEIGHYRLVAATSSATEPRMLTIAALESGDAPQSRLDGHYVYAPTLDEARRVLEGSYHGPTGTLLLDDAFSGTLTAAEVEVTNALPGTWCGDIRGANQIVNDALKRLIVWARIEIEGDGTRSYPLNDYPDLPEEWISHIEDRAWGTPADPVESSPFGFVVQQDGADRTLVTDRAYGDGSTFTLVAIRRGDAWIKSGGSWGAGSGLQSETDAAAAPLHWVRIWGAVAAYRYLIEATDEDETISEERRARRIARYRERMTSYGPAMRRIIRDELPRLAPRPRRPLRTGLFLDYPLSGAPLG